MTYSAKSRLALHLYRNICLGAALALGITVGVVAPALGVPAPPADYIFVLDAPRWLEIDRPDESLFGRVDAEGNFRVEKTTGPGPFTSPCRSSSIKLCRIRHTNFGRAD